ncbi:pyrroline-5-carboxylate reductase [Lentithecium fluviatile CBS 122367]|uniref:Proline dehydrogenase n=1 Tax=Lentithecium fluviatile CBS 122367 TaxID=1168545 RepID=A0A6G1J5M3_9PLEO|nr:pyrroline-5-carboxylate reductase [Lentithecium fluviatile CBS 122367]
MPMGMLLRSLCIATVSSNRLLLHPSLRLLAYFDKPDRSVLFNVNRNPVLHAILKKTVYNQFCAGETLEETSACVRRLKGLGFKGVILTYAKELVHDHNAAALDSVDDQAGSQGGLGTPKFDAVVEGWRVGTSKTIDLIEEGDILAVKMSGAGPAVANAFTRGIAPPQQFLDALDEIASKCKERGIQIIVDAESQKFQDSIDRVALELMRKFNRQEKAVIYNTYQAYLKSTLATIEQHMAEADRDSFTMGLKLVRGAYILSDDRSFIHDTKQDTDNAYNSIAHGALSQQIGIFGNSRSFPSLNLFLASHNRESVLSAQRLRQQRVKAGLPTVPVAFGQLHGMSDEVSFSLLQEVGEDGKSPDVFKCSTWGTMGECIGTGNLGTAILKSLITATVGDEGPNFDRFIACVHSDASKQRLVNQFKEQKNAGILTVLKDHNIKATQDSDIIILGVDPSDVEVTLKQEGLSQALKGKLLISVAAGWTRESLERLLPSTNESGRTWVIRTLPNIAAQVSQSLTAIEDPHPDTPAHYVSATESIFNQIGQTVRVAPRLMNATTAVGGSTPAMFAVICDALIDAAVAVGVPRVYAQVMIYQSMKGTAEMLQSGIHPGVLKDQGTSPEGCTIGGLMVLEEAGVRGGLGRALREAVTIARLMGGSGELHVNDTRQFR